MAELNGNGNRHDVYRDPGAENDGLSWTASDFDDMPDFMTLSCTLQPKDIVHIHSSFALLEKAAVSQPDLQHVKRISSGRQGIVFEHVGKPYVIKKENPTWVAKGSEFTIHREYFDNLLPAAAAFIRFRRTVKTNVRVSTPLGYVSETDTRFWDNVLPKMPPEHRTRGNAILMEHILPLTKVTRKALFAYAYGRGKLTTSQINTLVNDPDNKHCLVHPCLGDDDGDITKYPDFYLPFEWLRKVGMEMLELSADLGRAYAILHWGAGIDGRGVKCVLGTRNMGRDDTSHSCQRRLTGLYFIDFGECTRVNLEDDAYLEVYDAYINAMLSEKNKLIIPPISRRPGYFGGFKDAYCEASKFILEKRDLQDKFNEVDFMKRYENACPDSGRLNLPGNAFREFFTSHGA